MKDSLDQSIATKTNYPPSKTVPIHPTENPMLLVQKHKFNSRAPPEDAGDALKQRICRDTLTLREIDDLVYFSALSIQILFAPQRK